MSNQIGGDEIAQFIDKAANFETPSGVSVTVEFDDGTVMNHEWGTVDATPDATPEATTTEQGEPEIRDAWAKLAVDEWPEFQAMAAEHGVVNMKREPMIDTLTDMGVMPGDNPSDGSPEQSEPESFTDLSEDKQDDLRDSVETDPSDTDFKQVKSLLETGADYVALAGECLNHEEHEGEMVGAKLTKDGIIPFCNGCEHKADTVTVDRLSETEETIFSTLRKGGMKSSEALEAAEN
jgi:hypothetical protein